jgi:hypothetical protein
MPAFFDAVPPIVVYDALADALGAAADGIVEYGYRDVVKVTAWVRQILIEHADDPVLIELIV